MNRPGLGLFEISGTKKAKGLLGCNGSVPFPMQIALFLPFQNGESVIFAAEAVAQLNGPIFAKQAKRRDVWPIINSEIWPILNYPSPDRFVKSVIVR